MHKGNKKVMDEFHAMKKKVEISATTDAKAKSDGHYLIARFNAIESSEAKKTIIGSIANDAMKERVKMYHEKIRESVLTKLAPNAPFDVDKSRLENKQSCQIYEELILQSFVEISRLKKQLDSKLK